jgi:hypothetical protein
MQLIEYKEALGRKDYLVNQNFILCEKYEKAVKESNLLKEILEQAKIKCEKYSKEIAKQIEKLAQKGKLLNFLDLNKKEI